MGKSVDIQQSLFYNNYLEVLCTRHRLAPGVGPRANQGDCKMVGAKLRIFPRGGGI